MKRTFHDKHRAATGKDNESNWTNGIIISVLCVGLILIGVLFVYAPGVGIGRGNQKVVVGISEMASFNSEARKLRVTESFIVLSDGSKIRSRESADERYGEGRSNVLIFHDSVYTSRVWRGLGTLQILAKQGYRTVAIDLPGFGDSKSARQPDFQSKSDVVAWVNDLTHKMNLDNLVIVAPTASSAYALPILFANPKKLDFVLDGMILMTPDKVNRYKSSDFKGVDVPVIHLFGEKDYSEIALNAKKYLDDIPGIRQVPLTGVNRPAWVGNPVDFHSEILYFLVFSTPSAWDDDDFDDQAGLEARDKLRQQFQEDEFWGPGADWTDEFDGMEDDDSYGDYGDDDVDDDGISDLDRMMTGGMGDFDDYSVEVQDGFM